MRSFPSIFNCNNLTVTRLVQSVLDSSGMAMTLGLERCRNHGVLFGMHAIARQQQLRQRRHCVLAVGCASRDASEMKDVTKTFYVPTTLEETVDQARMACREAIKGGVTRLQLEMPLPLIGATDLDDWPGGIQQQFKAAVPMVSSLLTGLIPGEDGEFKNYLIDADDAVGAWKNEKVALVLFPTADSISNIQALASASKDRSLLLMNAQWREGQVISDFGFGAQRKAREDFINSFQVVYYLQQMRISGDNVRVFKRYPGIWQVSMMDSSGESECLAVEAEKPSYRRLQEILKQANGSSSKNDWLARIFQEFKFNAESMKPK